MLCYHSLCQGRIADIITVINGIKSEKGQKPLKSLTKCGLLICQSGINYANQPQRKRKKTQPPNLKAIESLLDFISSLTYSPGSMSGNASAPLPPPTISVVIMQRMKSAAARYQVAFSIKSADFAAPNT